jgi:phytoene synthase
VSDDISTLIRRVDEDRWLATRFAPADARARLLALYAVNYEVAHVAEAVREPGLGAIRLQWWREGLEEIALGAPPRAHPALRSLHQAAPALAAGLQVMVSARAADLEPAPFADWNALERYVDSSAGVLIALSVEACGVSPAGETRHAFVREAGRAWGYVGLMRAANQWRLRGRTLLPGPARIEDLRDRAASAWAAARAGVGALSAAAFPAFGYVALVGGYLRAMERGGVDTPLLARQARLVWASATGRL